MDDLDGIENSGRSTHLHTSAVTVSIIMPVHNCQTHVVEAVESIVQQTFQDWELIIIDDCSCDGTSHLISSFLDRRIRIIKCNRKMGIAKALNIGIETSRGAFIARMDGDDIAVPERISKQLDYMLKNPSLALIGSQAWLISTDDNVIAVKRKPVLSWLCRWYSRYATPLIHPSFFGRREVFINLGGYNNLLRAQDFEFVVRALDSGFKVGNHPEYLLYYRTHPSGSRRIKALSESKKIAWMIRRRLNPLLDEVPVSIIQGISKFTFLEANLPLSSSFFHRSKFIIQHSKGRIRHFLR